MGHKLTLKYGVLIIFLFLYSHFSVLGQQKMNKVLLVDYSFKLNSSVLGALLKPKEIIEVNLPRNTKSWFYSFNTSLNENNTELFKNFSSVVGNIALTYAAGATTGLSAFLLNNLTPEKIKLPTGEAAVSIYCLDETNSSSFMDMRKFTPLPFGMTEEQKQGIIPIENNYKGRLFLGIKNKSTFQRVVYVTLQVYAITEEITPIESDMTNGWSVENKRMMYERWYKKALKMRYADDIANDIATCTQNKILKKYSFSDKKQMNADLWNNLVTEIFNQCIKIKSR